MERAQEYISSKLKLSKFVDPTKKRTKTTVQNFVFDFNLILSLMMQGNIWQVFKIKRKF